MRVDSLVKRYNLLEYETLSLQHQLTSEIDLLVRFSIVLIHLFRPRTPYGLLQSDLVGASNRCRKSFSSNQIADNTFSCQNIVCTYIRYVWRVIK